MNQKTGNSNVKSNLMSLAKSFKTMSSSYSQKESKAKNSQKAVEDPLSFTQSETVVSAPTSVASHTVRSEARALDALARAIDTSLKSAFEQAVDLMLNTKGRVIITGMGKSGHIGSKIAATLSSTGTPSFFVHPGEASHGDLGMITIHDTVIALSNSGETTELSDVIAFTDRHDIPLICVTSKPESTLAKKSRVALILPLQPEACPHGLAPTTSSTMMLSLGDALAMALLSCKDFSAKDFGSFHPGGKLGQLLLTVNTLMHTGNSLPLVTPETSLSDTIITMTQKGFGGAGVLDAEDHLIGVISDGDLRRCLKQDMLNSVAIDVMNPNPKVIDETMSAKDALHFMNDCKITFVFVTNEQGKCKGILHVHDCLRAGLS